MILQDVILREPQEDDLFDPMCHTCLSMLLGTHQKNYRFHFANRLCLLLYKR